MACVMSFAGMRLLGNPSLLIGAVHGAWCYVFGCERLPQRPEPDRFEFEDSNLSRLVWLLLSCHQKTTRTAHVCKSWQSVSWTNQAFGMDIMKHWRTFNGKYRALVALLRHHLCVLSSAEKSMRR